MRPRSGQSYAEVLKKIFFEVWPKPEFWIFQLSAYGSHWLDFIWPWYHKVWLFYAYESLTTFWGPKKSIRVIIKPILPVIITVIPNSFSLLMAFIPLSPTFSPFFLLLCFSEILLVCIFVLFLKMGPLTAKAWGHWKFFLKKSQIRCFRIKNHFIPELTNSDEVCIQDRDGGGAKKFHIC